MTTAIAIPQLTDIMTNPEARKAFEVGAIHMAREYQEATAAMRAALEELYDQANRIHEAFSSADSPNRGTYNSFHVDISFGHRSIYRRLRDGDSDPYSGLFTEMKRRAWHMLADHLGIKNVMSIKRRAEFEKQLKEGDLPEITEETIVSVVLGLIGEAKNFAAEAAKEVFDMLTPHRSEYKTNSAFRVGRRVVLSYWVERTYGGGFRTNYNRDGQVRALEGAFMLMDGRSVIRDGLSDLRKAIQSATDGKGETEYFRFKCFKNGNLHIEFKRLDLVKQLNFLAAGEHVLGA